MKLDDLHEISATITMMEKTTGLRKGPALGGKKGKIRKKEDIGVMKAHTSPFARAIRATGKEQQQLALDADIHPSTISRYKTGVRVPSHETLAHLVDVMGLQPGDMFPELDV